MPEETPASKPPTPDAEPARQVLPLGYYARIAADEARRFRRGMTRENFNSFLKSMAWVVPLTLLIWVYAERENTDTIGNVPVHIDVAQIPGKVLTITYPVDRECLCVLKGPRTRLEQVRDMVARNINVKLGAPAGATDMSVQIVPLIQDDPLFKNEGISIDDCVPKTMIVSVDTLDEIDVPVVAPDNLKDMVQANFNPPEVKVRGPHKAVTALAPAGKLKIIADLGNLPQIQKAGQYTDVTVALDQLDPSGVVTMSRTDVQATLTVSEQDVTFTRAGIPFYNAVPAAPGGFWDTHSITTKDPVLGGNVKFVGPQDGIDKLKAGANQIVAVIVMSDQDKQTGDLPKTVRIAMLPDLTLPPGVHVESDSNLTVTVTIGNR